MPVFKLTPAQKAPLPDQDPKAPTALDTQSDLDELKQAQKVAGETPITSSEGTKEGETENKTGVFTTGHEESPPKTIKVDGPLGRIFTDTLDKMLAIESFTLTPLTDEAYVKLQAEHPDLMTVRVHAFRDDLVRDQAAFETTQDIDHSEGNDILVMEKCFNARPTSASGKLIRYCQRSNKVSIIMTMGRACAAAKAQLLK